MAYSNQISGVGTASTPIVYEVKQAQKATDVQSNQSAETSSQTSSLAKASAAAFQALSDIASGISSIQETSSAVGQVGAVAQLPSTADIKDKLSTVSDNLNKIDKFAADNPTAANQLSLALFTGLSDLYFSGSLDTFPVVKEGLKSALTDFASSIQTESDNSLTRLENLAKKIEFVAKKSSGDQFDTQTLRNKASEIAVDQANVLTASSIDAERVYSLVDSAKKEISAPDVKSRPILSQLEQQKIITNKLSGMPKPDLPPSLETVIAQLSPEAKIPKTVRDIMAELKNK